MSNGIRIPSVSGAFYPAEPDKLASMIDRYLAMVSPRGDTPRPKAIIVPHAGYIFSGPVAATAYAQLRAFRDSITRVVVLAPAHRLPFRGLAVSDAKAFRTPLGDIPVDAETLKNLKQKPFVATLDAAFDGEHSLEVQLPFLQRVLANFTLTPLIVGHAEPEQVREVLEATWGGDETLIVISSDLSHFLDYDAARERDAKTTRAIEERNPAAIDFHDACGRIPISGLLLAAKEHHLAVATLDLRNSGDTAGSRDRVVGYGAYRLA